MANVANSSHWSALTSSNRPRDVADNPPTLVSVENSLQPSLEATADQHRNSPHGHLSLALPRLFGGARDRIVWHAARDNESSNGASEFYRLDLKHIVANGAAPDDQPAAQASADKPWLVIVDRAENCLNGSRIEQLQQALDEQAKLLVIAWQETADDARVDSVEQDRLHAARQSLRSEGCDYVGLIDAADPGQLWEVLEKIKDQGQSTVLHLRTSPGTVGPPPPHFAPPRTVDAPDTLSIEVPRQLALQTVAALTSADERIAAIVTATDDDLEDSLSANPRFHRVAGGADPALECCARLMAEGLHPLVLLRWDEAQDAYGRLQRELSRSPGAWTLVVESSSDVDGTSLSSADLAGLRQLPAVRLLAPKDAAELRQMLAWCAGEGGHQVVWLPEAFAFCANWPRSAEIAAAEAEQLSTGHDVAIIAWGPMVAAASVAAENLALYQLEATVVNARFAQPLSSAMLERAVRAASCVVIVDDADRSGGFASWMLEHLLHVGITQPISIVAPSLEEAPYDRQNQCALRIVERCRWLAEPVPDNSTAQLAPEVARPAPPDSVAAAWLAPLSPTMSPACDEQPQILAQQFSPLVEHWVREYEKVGERDVYLWRWCLHGLSLTTLSCVAPEARQELCDTKLLAVMFGVMLDDIADQGGEEEFLNELAGIIRGQQRSSFERFATQQQQYAKFTSDLWKAFEDRLKCAPCFAEFEELLDYDHQQILNTMTYSCLVNRHPAMLNLQEHDMYLPHNMQMMSFATMDLMHSPHFDRRELGALREVIWHAQSMGRIGNLVSTWQREITDRDFTSGVFARALRSGDVSLEELRSASPPVIEAAIRRGGHEQYFLRKWESHRRAIAELAATLRSVDVHELLNGLQRLIHMELGSRGFK